MALCIKERLMHEQEKLKEAKHFFAKMRKAIDDPDAFHFELSAFLSSSRSILQYGSEEAKTMPRGQAWYDSHVSGNSILQYFKDKRDINIHAEPVKANQQISVTVNEHIHISESLKIEIQREDGSIEIREHNEPNSTPESKPDDSTIMIKYTFSDWSGTEDVIELCEKYINALEAFINNGQADGFLTK